MVIDAALPAAEREQVRILDKRLLWFRQVSRQTTKCSNSYRAVR
jgi:hypothetical protein